MFNKCHIHLCDCTWWNMFSHAQSLLIQAQKGFLIVLGVFGKYFVLKISKISKIQFCPVLATQSRVSQVTSLSRVLAGHFWRLVREWKVQSWGLLRDFRGSARDFLAGRTSSCEKHLEKFFKLFSLSVLATWTGDLLATLLSREKRVFGKNRGSF